MTLMIKAIEDTLYPAFIINDVPIFQQLMEDVFPGIEAQKIVFEKMDILDDIIQ